MAASTRTISPWASFPAMAALVEGAERRLSREEAEERATRAMEPLCGAFVGVAVGAGVGVTAGMVAPSALVR